MENAFGILANRFRCLLTTMPQRPQTSQVIVLACICLHNLMRTRYPGEQNAVMDRQDADHNVIPGEWRQDRRQLDDSWTMSEGPATQVAKRQRDNLKE